MTIEIKTTETTFDVDDAMTDHAFSTIATLGLGRLGNLYLYSSVNPIIVWNENDVVREARRISSKVKTVIDNLQNMEVGLTDEVLDREIIVLTACIGKPDNCLE